MDGASGVSACGHYLQMLAKLAHIYFQNGLHCKRPIEQQIPDTETPLGGTQKTSSPGHQSPLRLTTEWCIMHYAASSWVVLL